MVIKLPQLIREFFCDTFVITKFRLQSLLYFLALFITFLIIFFYSISLNPSSIIHHYPPLIQSILAFNLTNKFENYLPTSFFKNDNSTNNLTNPSEIAGNDVKRILFWTPFYFLSERLWVWYRSGCLHQSQMSFR
jgi:hypothetical protein